MQPPAPGQPAPVYQPFVGGAVASAGGAPAKPPHRLAKPQPAIDRYVAILGGSGGLGPSGPSDELSFSDELSLKMGGYKEKAKKLLNA